MFFHGSKVTAIPIIENATTQFHDEEKKGMFLMNYVSYQKNLVFLD